MGKAKTINSIRDVRPQRKNSNKHTSRGLGLLEDSIQRDGWIGAITVASDGETFDGSARVEVGASAGFEDAIVVESDGTKPVIVRRTDIKNADDPKAKRLGVAANRIAQIDFAPDADVLAELVKEGIDLSDLYTGDEFTQLLNLQRDESDVLHDTPRLSLVERFGVPPFSVLDARQGYWQDRKRAWRSIGISSEIGREGELIGTTKLPSYAINGTTHIVPSTSIFDPVLCELVYRWFSADGAQVLDPFAGGSVRGIVAAKLGRQYTGVDLRAEQIAANEAQGKNIVPDNMPRWIVGDSTTAIPEIQGDFDFIFSCPPYADLEVYSDDPQDLSTMDYAAFVEAYRAIIAASVAKLKQNRFACFVVGDVRDKKGFYRNFVSDTIKAFEDAGGLLYNDAILITQVGTAALTAPRAFNSGRKLGKTHQNVLVFYKGDPKQIKTLYGACDFGEISESMPDTVNGGV